MGVAGFINKQCATWHVTMTWHWPLLELVPCLWLPWGPDRAPVLAVKSSRVLMTLLLTRLRCETLDPIDLLQMTDKVITWTLDSVIPRKPFQQAQCSGQQFISLVSPILPSLSHLTEKARQPIHYSKIRGSYFSSTSFYFKFQSI